MLITRIICRLQEKRTCHSLFLPEDRNIIAMRSCKEQKKSGAAGPFLMVKIVLQNLYSQLLSEMFPKKWNLLQKGL